MATRYPSAYKNFGTKFFRSITMISALLWTAHASAASSVGPDSFYIVEQPTHIPTGQCVKIVVGMKDAGGATITLNANLHLRINSGNGDTTYNVHEDQSLCDDGTYLDGFFIPQGGTGTKDFWVKTNSGSGPVVLKMKTRSNNSTAYNTISTFQQIIELPIAVGTGGGGGNGGNTSVPVNIAAGHYTVCEVQSSPENPLAYIRPCEGWSNQNCQSGSNEYVGWSVDGNGTNGGTSTLSLALAAMLSGTSVEIWYGGGCAGEFDRLDTLKLVLNP